MLNGAWHLFENASKLRLKSLYLRFEKPPINACTPHMVVCHWLQCARKAMHEFEQKLRHLVQNRPPYHLTKIIDVDTVFTDSASPVDSRVIDHREGRPLDLRLPLPCPRTPCCPQDSPMSTPTAIFPRSAVVQRRRLSLKVWRLSSKITFPLEVGVWVPAIPFLW
jgi:hypothetical protein